MFERFTDPARRVMALANAQAQRLHHEYLGTEHILFGIISEGTDFGAQVLKDLGAEKAVVARMEELSRAGPEGAGAVGSSTPRAKLTVQLATKQADSLGQDYVDTGHLLLGLILEGDGVAATALRQAGVSAEKVKETYLRLLAGLEQLDPYQRAMRLPQLEFWIDPGGASPAVLRAVLQAFDELHQAYGGLGLEFRGDGHKILVLSGAKQ